MCSNIFNLLLQMYSLPITKSLCLTYFFSSTKTKAISTNTLLTFLFEISVVIPYGGSHSSGVL